MAGQVLITSLKWAGYRREGFHGFYLLDLRGEKSPSRASSLVITASSTWEWTPTQPRLRRGYQEIFNLENQGAHR